MADHNELGKIGEEIAAKYFVQNGYKILERNWRFGNDEVDIILQKEKELIFVEVKTRKSDFFGSAVSFVNKAKQRFMIRAASAYVERNDIDLEARFDVLGIVLNRSKPDIEHIDDAFQPSW